MEILVWLPVLFARGIGLTSYKSDLQIVGCLPGLVTVDDGLVSWDDYCTCGSEFYFHTWSGHDPFVYLVSQLSCTTSPLFKFSGTTYERQRFLKVWQNPLRNCLGQILLKNVENTEAHLGTSVNRKDWEICAYNPWCWLIFSVVERFLSKEGQTLRYWRIPGAPL